jgi:hypothetical protein
MTKKIKQLKVVCSCVAMNEVTILSSSLSLSFLLVQIGIMLCSYRKQRKKITLLSVQVYAISPPTYFHYHSLCAKHALQEKDYSVK